MDQKEMRKWQNNYQRYKYNIRWPKITIIQLILLLFCEALDLRNLFQSVWIINFLRIFKTWKLTLISFQYPDKAFHSKFDVSRVEWQKTSTHQTYISEFHPAPLSYEEWSVLAEKEDKTFTKEPQTVQSRIW